jgi:hypothetical protein
MSNRYEPPSDFLRGVMEDEVPLVGGHYAQTNLRRLIDLTRDEHAANRDWATLLLAQQELDTPDVREALRTAASDVSGAVRGEAILGLAQRDKALALPFLQQELGLESVTTSTFEAAALVADPSLLESLLPFSAPSGDDFLDQLVLDTIVACERGGPVL